MRRPLLALAVLLAWVAVACTVSLRLGPSIEVYGPDATVPGHKTGATSYQGSPNPTGFNPLCTTGYTESNGIVCSTKPVHVRSLYIFNNTAAATYAVLSDSWQIPTSFANNQDASVSDSGPGMIGTPFLVPANGTLQLGTTFFGEDGWLTTTGFSVGMVTFSTQPDGGTDAGLWTPAAPNYFDITVNGQ